MKTFCTTSPLDAQKRCYDNEYPSMLEIGNRELTLPPEVSLTHSQPVVNVEEVRREESSNLEDKYESDVDSDIDYGNADDEASDAGEDGPKDSESTLEDLLASPLDRSKHANSKKLKALTEKRWTTRLRRDEGRRGDKLRTRSCIFKSTRPRAGSARIGVILILLGSDCKLTGKQKQSNPISITRSRAVVNPTLPGTGPTQLDPRLITALRPAMTAKILQFVPFNSSIDPAFWHSLTQLKIDILKLGDEPVPIQGWYERGRWTVERDQSSKVINQVGFGNEFRVDGKSLSSDQDDHHPQTSSTTGRVAVWGMLKNFNTIEEFKACDKQSLFNSFSDQLWKNKVEKKKVPAEDKSPEFLLITFSDLKKYKYYYWFAFPAFLSKPSWTVLLDDQDEHDGDWPILPLEDTLELNSLILQNNYDHHCWIGKRDPASKQWSLGPLSQWTEFFQKVEEENRYLIFIDPAVHPQATGWPLRNLLAHLQAHHGNQARKFKLIGYRDPLAEKQSLAVARSVVVTIELPEQESTQGRPAAVGWEKNAAGKLGPRMADLAPMMDPTRLAEQAVDLNLKLMRWRILPDLNLEKISSTRCLLLGAGTLGCYVARTLVAWGVRKVTFVDSAKVSFSNPVRQPLFEFQDCLEGGKPKAACASAALKRIYPGLETEGIELPIPMPGHPIPPNLVEQTKAQVAQLEKLFDGHDVVYLLMDSRESRWLPTLLGASKRKLVINAALGFDSYLVMRHGVRSSSSQSPAPVADDKPSGSVLPQIRQLGCYFCNDVVAPSDSLTDRTLDQMCTVTRPGLAPIASATAVEMMASVLQHPQGVEVLAEVIDKSRSKEEEAAGRPASIQESVLGLVPHQIRGFLAKFENLKLVGPAYDKCTGCSHKVINEYEKSKFSMLLQAFNDPKYLENLTGLSQLYEDSQQVNMESLEWDDDEDNE
ncbi:hypothetical protein PtB15_3B805 [Puccinia triticina]|nr:hypothetical protein PtB15_3B805 [Puccinia triticina]